MQLRAKNMTNINWKIVVWIIILAKSQFCFTEKTKKKSKTTFTQVETRTPQCIYFYTMQLRAKNTNMTNINRFFFLRDFIHKKIIYSKNSIFQWIEKL